MSAVLQFPIAISSSTIESENELNVIVRHIPPTKHPELGNVSNTLLFLNYVQFFLETLSPSFNFKGWEYTELSNDGFYIAPVSAKSLIFETKNNIIGMVSKDAAGIIASLLSYKTLSTKIDCTLMDIKYELLNNYASQLPEVKTAMSLM